MGDEEGGRKEGEKEEVIVRVGYALEAKKVESLLKPSLVRYASDRGIRFVSVDLQKEQEQEQGLKLHCLVHKLYGPDWQRLLLDFQSRHPEVVIIDPPSSILRLHHRTTMLHAVSAISHSLPIRIPNQLVFPGNTDAITFPVIAKPLSADGDAACHQMSLVFGPQGLKSLQSPVLLQEFVNHGGVVFKVYVAGHHVRCVARPSLPDVDAGSVAEPEAVAIPFSRISNTNTDAGLSEAGMPPSEFINKLAAALRGELNLNLFNFDLIRDSQTNTFLVIDINYFPGYAKIPGFEAFLTQFFLDIASNAATLDQHA